MFRCVLFSGFGLCVCKADATALAMSPQFPDWPENRKKLHCNALSTPCLLSDYGYGLVVNQVECVINSKNVRENTHRQLVKSRKYWISSEMEIIAITENKYGIIRRRVIVDRRRQNGGQSLRNLFLINFLHSLDRQQNNFEFLLFQTNSALKEC